MKSLFLILIVCSAFQQFACLEYSEVVDLPSGKIRGAIEQWRGRMAYEYKGIPYASAPVGSLRYVKPTAPKSWEGIKDTLAYEKSCPQNAWAIKFEDTDEDCLYLNVHVNKETFDHRDKHLKPVLFWINGGGFQTGSGNEHDAYKGIPLVIVEDVVLVTINYRLGVLGFLNGGDVVPSLVPNLGLWDQNFALKWVRENIHRFGGDPNQITIFGQSAGSAAVAYHVLSPQSAGMFKRAIMESGGIMRFTPKENMTEATSSFVSAVGCKDAAEKLSCLQAVPWTEILAATQKTFLAPIFEDEFLPIFEDEAIATGQYNDVDLIAGAERDEGDGLICGTYKFAALKASNSNTSTYGYIHTQAPLKHFGLNGAVSTDRKSDKVGHCDELVYVFGAPLREPEDYDIDDVALSITIMKIWGDFARTGKPTRQGPIDWPQIGDSNKIKLLDLNNNYVGKTDEVTGTKCFTN